VRHAEDPLLAADRFVRRMLGVRDGQTIVARAREILRDGRGEHSFSVLNAAAAVLDEPIGWYGTARAASILGCNIASAAVPCG
jgi:hypothetical protein